MSEPILLEHVPTIDPETSPLYLSRLELNRRNILVHREVTDSQAFHRRILDAFPRLDEEHTDAARATLGVLYRLDPIRTDNTIIVALVQSVAAPNWSVLPPGYVAGEERWDTVWDGAGISVKRLDDRYRAIETGQFLRFRLRANPTRRDATRGGKRVALTDDEFGAWFQRKEAQHGFRLHDIRFRDDPLVGDTQTGRKPSEKPGRDRLTHAAVLFEGILEVTDAAVFRAALWQGIGSAKAYGFGLLSVAPVVREG